ncbi:MAG: hypothetical protein H0X51_05935 [Parachlamydiaceae bacterium]|nr:hypothetical protein [Parachlamydiaceae bacterium]
MSSSELSLLPLSVQTQPLPLTTKNVAAERFYKVAWVAGSCALTALNYYSSFYFIVGCFFLGDKMVTSFVDAMSEPSRNDHVKMRRWMIVACMILSGACLSATLVWTPYALSNAYSYLKISDLYNAIYELTVMTGSIGFAGSFAKELYSRGLELLRQPVWQEMQEYLKAQIPIEKRIKALKVSLESQNSHGTSAQQAELREELEKLERDKFEKWQLFAILCAPETIGSFAKPKNQSIGFAFSSLEAKKRIFKDQIAAYNATSAHVPVEEHGRFFEAILNVMVNLPLDDQVEHLGTIIDLALSVNNNSINQKVITHAERIVTDDRDARCLPDLARLKNRLNILTDVRVNEADVRVNEANRIAREEWSKFQHGTQQRISQWLPKFAIRSLLVLIEKKATREESRAELIRLLELFPDTAKAPFLEMKSCLEDEQREDWQSVIRSQCEAMQKELNAYDTKELLRELYSIKEKTLIAYAAFQRFGFEDPDSKAFRENIGKYASAVVPLASHVAASQIKKIDDYIGVGTFDYFLTELTNVTKEEAEKLLETLKGIYVVPQGELDAAMETDGIGYMNQFIEKVLKGDIKAVEKQDIETCVRLLKEYRIVQAESKITIKSVSLSKKSASEAIRYTTKLTQLALKVVYLTTVIFINIATIILFPKMFVGGVAAALMWRFVPIKISNPVMEYLISTRLGLNIRRFYNNVLIRPSIINPTMQSYEAADFLGKVRILSVKLLMGHAVNNISVAFFLVMVFSKWLIALPILGIADSGLGGFMRGVALTDEGIALASRTWRQIRGPRRIEIAPAAT